MKPASRTALVGIMIALAGCKPHAMATPSQASVVATPASGRVSVTVDDEGYHPSSLRAPAGQPLTLVFTRTTDTECARRVVFPALHLERELPRNQPVEITVTPTTGTLAFACGMDMLHGSIVAQ